MFSSPLLTQANGKSSRRHKGFRDDGVEGRMGYSWMVAAMLGHIRSRDALIQYGGSILARILNL